MSSCLLTGRCVVPEVTPKQFREAALAAVRTIRQEALYAAREFNPVIDVSAERAAETLAVWMTQSQGSPVCRSEDTHLTVPSFESDGVEAVNGWLDLSSGRPGAIIWHVVPMVLGGKRYTMLIGAARLHGGDWTLVRQVAVVRGSDVVFEHDELWYHNRRKRTRDVSPVTGQPSRRR